MKRYRILMLALLAALVLPVCVSAANEGNDAAIAEIAAQTVGIVSDPDAPRDNDELFYEYMLQLAREQMASASPTRGSASLFKTTDSRTVVETAGSKLTGNDKKAYDYLRPQIEAIAGSGGSTVIEIPFTVFGYPAGTGWALDVWGADSFDAACSAIEDFVGNSINQRNIRDALLADCPYSLYWYDKQTGFAMGAAYKGYAGTGTTISVTGGNAAIVFTFAVADEYAGADTKTIEFSNGAQTYKVEVDGGKITAHKVAAAVTTAADIVAANASKSDYEKLVAYKEAICDAVEYNTAAVSSGNTPYGNPWQLIWVFDGDPTTNIVCEGYSKAFKYLCDLSAFESDVQCYLATGYMAGGTGAGAHMWNIVTLESRNYLVDVTNCDGDSSGAPDYLFLRGVTTDGLDSGTKLTLTIGGVETQVAADFAVNIPKRQIDEHSYYRATTLYYWFDAPQKTGRPAIVWQTAKPELLTLSTTDYQPPTVDYTDVSDGNYSYAAKDGTLYLKPVNGTAYLILARYEGGRMAEVRMQTVSAECAVENMTDSANWFIFSVDGMDTCIPRGAKQALTISAG